MQYRAWLCFSFAAMTGCGTGVSLPGSNGLAADSGVVNNDASAADGGVPVYGGNPDGDGLIKPYDSGVVQVVDPNGEPTCGASSFEAEQVVVDSIVEVPEEITEEVPEEVTEEVTEEITTIKPTVLYLMFDQSLSMAGGLNYGANKWDPAVAAVKSFVKDPDSAGLGVALQYFPISGGSCSNGNGYKTPAVAVGTLPAKAQEISNSLDAHNPEGIGTPIEGALRGVTEYCKTYQAAHPDEQCVSVLVTDGKAELASGCEENTDKLAAIAKAAHDSGVITFAVGLNGANFTLLDKIAQQGGAPDCEANNARYACDVSSGADKLSVALNTIREKVVKTETKTVKHTVTKTITKTVTKTQVVSQVVKSAVPCEWTIPATTGGQTFDRDRVNIRLSADGKSTTFVRVGGKDKCLPNAWYFDDANAPTRFIACEQSCQAITGAPDARIDILLGCATITPG